MTVYVPSAWRLIAREEAKKKVGSDMRSTFGTPRDCMAGALNSFSKALTVQKHEAKGRLAVDAIFSDAMQLLFGVRIASGNPISEEELIEFKFLVVQLIGAEPDNLFRYIYDSFDCVWSSPDDGWDAAGMRRSAIQLLFDEFPGGVALFSTEGRELLDEIDEAFCERVRFVPPMPDDDIPPDLPESHWWWRLPEKTR